MTLNVPHLSQNVGGACEIQQNRVEFIPQLAEREKSGVSKGGSCFPESQNVLANIAFSFQGVLERNQETQRPAGSTLQRAGGEEKECTGERSRARVWRKVSLCFD